ncbi:Phosphoinositide phosphatase SAC6 [Olea europaea subsp. europaea]|uniref:Phosphoinositide phosphatase SAC6 n=1 Tax=Olea europaea subsp. europaea TaxID=158383 RepID=A0A8S0QYW2_OLEEU|nr:Phosphoinositide phosphatase SAC6 [Olea europaea subsp. europaea]
MVALALMVVVLILLFFNHSLESIFSLRLSAFRFQRWNLDSIVIFPILTNLPLLLLKKTT